MNEFDVKQELQRLTNRVNALEEQIAAHSGRVDLISGNPPSPVDDEISTFRKEVQEATKAEKVATEDDSAFRTSRPSSYHLSLLPLFLGKQKLTLLPICLGWLQREEYHSKTVTNKKEGI